MRRLLASERARIGARSETNSAASPPNATVSLRRRLAYRLGLSELRKLAATPTIWWLLAGVVVMAVVATLAMFALGDQRGLPPDSDETLRNAMHAAGAGSTFVIVSGIIGMAGEFRFGQADQTFLTTPSRGMVVAAKTLVYSVLGLLFGAVAALATALTGQIWLSQQGLVLPLERPEVWLTLVGAIASGALYGALGVGIGAVTRNQVVAIVATLASLLVLEPTLFMAADSVVRWLPGAAGQALRRDPADGLVSMGWGAVVLGSYVLTAVILGTRRIVRSDVT